jgi:glutathione S-transferase
VIELFAHSFSSYCWKVLIALYENETPFTLRALGTDQPDNGAAWKQAWPMGKMPVLVEDGRMVVETDAIVEYLDRLHPGPVRLLPDDHAAAVEMRMMTRIFDDYVMTPMNKHVADALRPADARDPHGVAQATDELDTIYAWLNERLTGRAWSAGEPFTLADCAAAPSLFYSDWVRPIPERFATLRAHRAKLLARPSVARCVEDARPYRSFFPLGAPDRD